MRVVVSWGRGRCNLIADLRNNTRSKVSKSVVTTFLFGLRLLSGALLTDVVVLGVQLLFFGNHASDDVVLIVCPCINLNLLPGLVPGFFCINKRWICKEKRWPTSLCI